MERVRTKPYPLVFSKGKMKMNTLIRTGNMNRRFERSVVYGVERELNLRSKLQISYTAVIRPPLIISWKL